MTAGAARWAVLALALLAGCAGEKEPGGSGLELAGLLPPAPEMEGWNLVEGPVAHSQETLYEYLDGAAERYLTHGFQRLLHARYRLGDDPLASVTIDIYDMGSELGAFGIYSAVRWPEVEARRWGTEGYRDGTVAAAWKGGIFVHGEADDDRPLLIEMLERLVARAAGNAAGEASPPAVLAVLPPEGRLPRSERYVPANLLGHAFLPGGVTATYEVEGRRAELFFCDLGSEVAANEALEAFRDHLSRRGTLEVDLRSIGAGGFRYAEPVLGSGTVVRAGSLVAGIHGGMSVEEREHILLLLVNGLSQR